MNATKGGGAKKAAAKKSPKKPPMSKSHKAALAQGRVEGRIIRSYLDVVEANKPKRGRKRTIESITLDRGAGHLKDDLMPRYSELIYNGFWFAPEREMLQALIDKSQENVEGEVRLKLYKGNVIVTGRESPKSLYSSTLVTFEDDKGAYDQKDAEGFIRLNALRLRTLAARNAKKAATVRNSNGLMRTPSQSR